MAKQTGLGMLVTVTDGTSATTVARDLSNDITSLTFGTTFGQQDITGLDKMAIERILLLADGKVDLSGVLNYESNKSHAVFSANQRTARQIVINIGDGTGAQPTGSPVLTLNTVMTEYTFTRAANGEATWKVSLLNQDGILPIWSTHA